MNDVQITIPNRSLFFIESFTFISKSFTNRSLLPFLSQIVHFYIEYRISPLFYRGFRNCRFVF